MYNLEDFNYYNDRRVRAASRKPLYKVTRVNGKATVTLSERLQRWLLAEDDSCDDCTEDEGCNAHPHGVGVDVGPFHDAQVEAQVCGMCRGHAKVVNPAIDAGGLTQEDFDEDPDFEEAYFAGRYDVTCPECKGERVTWEWVPPEHVAKAISDLEDEDACRYNDFVRGY